MNAEDECGYLPTPEQIAEHAALIRSRWSPAVRAKRQVWKPARRSVIPQYGLDVIDEREVGE